MRAHGRRWNISFAIAYGLLMAVASARANGRLSIREIAHSSTSVTLELIFPPPQFDTASGGRVRLSPLSEQVRNDDPFAAIAIPIRAGKNASVTILSKESNSVGVNGLIAVSSKAIHHAIGYASTRFVGRMRGADISQLIVGTYNRLGNTLSYARKIIVRITDPNGFSRAPITDLSEPFHVPNAVFRSRLSPSSIKGARILSDSDVQQTPGIQSDDGAVYRMSVRRSGIYHLDYEDMKNFGVDPGTIDPKTLRIINHGQQVAVYVFDHGDGHLDPDDYIEFYGEEKRYAGPGTLGDFYYDPDTKNNIYYLVWGTHYSPIPLGGVKRMVEESGEIRVADRSKFSDLKDSSFTTTLHIEQDLYHDDLVISDIDQRSDLRDHDFMALIYAGKSFSTETVVPFPDVRQNLPIKFRAALHGISHFDPGASDAKGIELPNVENENVASISVNSQTVLHGTWDSQTPKFLSTDTASQSGAIIPSAQLLGVKPGDSSGGIPPITILVQNQRDQFPGYSYGCRFAFNWIDITYDRMYYAYQDKLIFHAPKQTAGGLYQFTLQNFASTDISVYRKGVSKITNVVISSNPTQLRSAKAIFQINVASSADEFIAVVDSAKLKPAKYVRDDFENLRSPTNGAEYIVITNHDHINKTTPGKSPIDDLLKVHQTYDHVTTKVIDVANIYDEFSNGARSPNAIKAFLSYAYYHWQDPPKYVLLVGATHQGTDDPRIYTPDDQVPTPYVQAYLEGAVAGDAWYGMIEGDDLVPDIVIGRLATTTTTEDAAYVQKVKDQIADLAKPGDWKNRAYFINASGSFETDVDGIITRDLPRTVSVVRQSTNVNSPYHGNLQTLFNNVNTVGVGMMAYFGHGGSAIWDDALDSTGQPVLTNYDVPNFHNAGRYPAVLSMTCFTATYDGSGVGILNSLLSQPQAGAIIAMGTTSFGWQLNDEHLAEAVIPHLYDSLPGTYAERILEGKIEYLLRANPGDLIPPTLMYAYHFLGDPLLTPHLATDIAGFTVSNRVVRPGGQETITGHTSIGSGTAQIELVNEVRSPLALPHTLNVPVTGGQFSVTDNVPNTSIQYGMYRVTISDNADAKYAAAAEDVTITPSRITELDILPRPLPVGISPVFSVAVQSQSISSVVANFNVYSQNASGATTMASYSGPMTLAASGDRYEYRFANKLNPGDKIVASATLNPASDSVTSDSIAVIVGAASDPSVWSDRNHRTLTGKYISTSTGLAWRERLYNWGATAISAAGVSLSDLLSATAYGNTSGIAVPAHGNVAVDIPVAKSSLDSTLFVASVAPDAGTTPLNLRDSVIANDTTVPQPYAPAAVAYQQQYGTTFSGSSHAVAHFNNDEVILSLSPKSESNVSYDVIRLNRQYLPITTVQPDIHFLPLYTDKGKAYSSLRVVSDSLGAIPLADSSSTLTVHVDSLVGKYPIATLFIYRQDDRTKLWSKLSTAALGNTLTAKLTNLGNFAIAYNTDSKDPVVDITVEGQVFTNHGEVPPQPRIHAVLQDANGIDVTPAKTIVKIDNRQLQPSEYSVLDSGRTTTTVNLIIQPSLTDGNHAITIQTTDDNGRTNAPPKELDVHVSKDFGVGVLGSFPNPFTKDYMFIAYEIRGIAYAQSVSLDLYTVSGRHIRTLAFPSNDPTRTFGFLKGGTGLPTSLGYHEVWWDGRDDDGNEVANGVYFYRLIVNANGVEREFKGKFARVR